MSAPEPLSIDKLRSRSDPHALGFSSTDDLEDLPDGLGQQRAEEALRFGLRMAQPGYNVFVLGEAGTGRHATVWRILRDVAAARGVPSDLCYLHNFDNPLKPRLLRLPAGIGAQLRAAMHDFVRALGPVIAAALSSDDYRSRVEALQQGNKAREELALQALARDSEAEGLTLLRTPEGLVFAPSKDGEPLTPEVYATLAEDERRRLEVAVTNWGERLEALAQEFPAWRRELANGLQRAARDALAPAVRELMAGLRSRFETHAAVQGFLDAVQADVLTAGAGWRNPGEDEEPVSDDDDEIRFHRYQVNLVVDNATAMGAPIIEEDNPGYGNLIGRIEHVNRMGTPVTGYNLIRAGALHRAQGGYLVLDANRLFRQPYAWEGLKRALRSRELRIEPPAEAQGWSGALTLEPEAVPCDLKIVLVGDRQMYYMLERQDPDFAELFKIAADFEDELPRSADSERHYARLVATLARGSALRGFDAGAVALLIEQAARWADDAQCLSLQTRLLADLMREADLFAADGGASMVGREHIDEALDARRRRTDRYPRRVRESMLDGTLLVATEGAVTGQINGLVVLEVGGEAFGHPTRITATARVGDGDLVDIERETDLGGSLHSKGVLILSSFLAARYARKQPLSLAASLVFEQSYNPVEGDSASLAELCALMSSLAQVPIRQSLAITGSVNQFGVVQAIGGVNEKIEGFFELCAERGLTGEQGVVVPASNVRHLMLRDEVLDAVADGRFRVHAVETVDQAIEILTGMPAGDRSLRGSYEGETINARVARTLAAMTVARHAQPGDSRAGAGRSRHAR